MVRGLLFLCAKRLAHIQIKKIRHKNDIMNIIRQDNKCGLSDDNNNLLIPCLYQSLSPILPTLNRRSVHEYAEIGTNEYVCAQKDGYCGVLSLENAPILPFEYEEIRRYSIDDLFVVRKNQKWGVVNRNNELIVAFEYDDLGNYFVGGGIIAKQNNLYGIIKADGSQIVPFSYDNMQYVDPEDGYLRQPHWLLYQITHQNRKYTFGYNYLLLDLSIYGQQTQLTGNFVSKNRCEYTLSVYAGNLDFGKIILKSDGEEWEQVEYSKYRLVSPENSYTYALDQLATQLQQNLPTDAKYLKNLLGKVYTWSHLFWEKISPYINANNLHCVAEIMVIGLKKAASKEDIACGKKIFYEQGLRLLHQHSSTADYETHCNYLLAAVAKTPVKRQFLLDCFF
jgi:hypothetical protein